ncbi:MAG: DUF3618 domain-containing protein [Microthrixaceae bacterium]
MDTRTDELSPEELRRDIAARRDDIGRDLDAIGDRLSPGRMVERTRGRARTRVGAMRERVMGSTSSASSSVGDTTRRVGEQGQHAGTSVKEAPGQALHSVEDRVEGSPLAAGLVAFAFGFLAGSLVPGTRRESELAPLIEPQLEEATRAVAVGAKDAAAEVAEVAKDEATDAKQQVTDAAHEVTSSAKDHARAAKDEVAPGGGRS